MIVTQSAAGWGRIKPPPGTPLNRNHPVARAAVRIWTLDSLQDADRCVGAKLTPTSTPSVTEFSPWGRAANTSTTAYWTHPVPSELVSVASFSAILVHHVRSTITDGSDFFGEWDNGSPTGQFLRYSGSAQWFCTNTSSATANITYPTWAVGRSHVSVWTADGANINAYHNGVRAATPVALAGPYLPSISRNWGIGFGRFSGVNSGAWYPSLIGYLNRALTPAEVSAWSRDPWAIFAPPARTPIMLAEAGAPPSTNIPVFVHHYAQQGVF